MKKTTFLMAFALAAPLAMAQEKAATPAPAAAAKAQSQPADPVIIKAGTISITQSEFEGAVKTLPEQYQQFALGQGKRQFAEDFLRLKLLSAEGMRNGLDKDPDVLKQLSLMRENLVAQAQLSRLDKAVIVSDADLKAAYDANKKDYEQVHRTRPRPRPKTSARRSPRGRSSRTWPRRSRMTSAALPTAATSATSITVRWCRSSIRRPSL